MCSSDLAVVGEQRKNHNPLLDFVEANAPEGWSLGVLELPMIGPNDSKREFKATIRAMLDIPPPIEVSTEIVLEREISSGTIHLEIGRAHV